MNPTVPASEPSRFDLRRFTDLVRRRPPAYLHDHPPVRNVNQEMADRITPGQRIADAVANNMGSWRFIIIQSCVIAVWVSLNIIGLIERWDPYPFILLNLGMSLQAAYAAPVIMMSQNRQNLKDRMAAEHDYEINLKAEEEVKAILQHLEYQDEIILQILHRLEGRVQDGENAIAGNGRSA